MNFVLLTFITIFIVVPQVSASFVAFIDDEGILRNEWDDLMLPKPVAPKSRLEDERFHRQFLTTGNTAFVLSFICFPTAYESLDSFQDPRK